MSYNKVILPRNLQYQVPPVDPFDQELPKEKHVVSLATLCVIQNIRWHSNLWWKWIISISLLFHFTTCPIVPLDPFCPTKPGGPVFPTGPVSPRWPWWPLAPWTYTKVMLQHIIANHAAFLGHCVWIHLVSKAHKRWFDVNTFEPILPLSPILPGFPSGPFRENKMKKQG